MSGLANAYAAILFDFDGVLGRTMEDNYAAWENAFSTHGIALQREDYFLLEGAPISQVAETVLTKAGGDLQQASKIAAQKEQYYAAHNSFSFYDGASELIEELRAVGLKLGLVSGATRARLIATCGAPFLGRFEAIVTGDDVRRGKPAPEPYLCAASKLGVLPAQCLVVENAPLGIASAKSAGMDCVAITSTLDAKFLREADVVISHLGQLSAVVSSLQSTVRNR